jgi:hypothetical protein
MSGCSSVCGSVSLQPGDSVLFNRGDTWRVTLSVTASGTFGNPITFGSYGAGALPIISGADLLTSWALNRGSVYYATEATSPRAVWQNNMQLTGPVANVGAISAGTWFWDTTTNRLYVWTADSSNPSTKTIESPTRLNGIVITDKNYVTINALQVEKTNDVFKGAIWANGDAVGSTDITVKNSTVLYGMSSIMFFSVNNAVATGNSISGEKSTDLSGVLTSDDSGNGGRVCKNPTVTYNTIHDVRFGTNQPNDTTNTTTGGTFSHNTIFNTTSDGIDFNKATAPLIEYNLVHDAGISGSDMSGIHPANTPNSVIRYNLVYNVFDVTNTGGHCIQTDNISDGSQVYYNVAYNCTGAGVSVNNSANVLVYNNTLHGNCQGDSPCGEITVLSPAQTSSATVKNNAAYATKAGAYAIYLSAASAAVEAAGAIDTNDWYGASGNWYFDGSVGGATLATWNAESYVGSDVNSDPTFCNVATRDLRICTGSPDIATATNIGSPYQNALNPVSLFPFVTITQNTHWDIGAFAYQTGVQAPEAPTNLTVIVAGLVAACGQFASGVYRYQNRCSIACPSVDDILTCCDLLRLQRRQQC